MRLLVFIACLCSLLTISSYGKPSPETKAELTLIQKSLDAFISQSNLDPDTTQQLLVITADLTNLAKNSNQQEMNDLLASTHITCFLESLATILKKNNIITSSSSITSLKYSSRSNIVHKLIMSASKGLLDNEAYYTNPYLESIGYMCNEWLFNTILTSLLAPAKKESKTTVTTTSASLGNTLMIQVISGIAAHCVWLLQKKLVLPIMQQKKCLKKGKMPSQ